MGSNMLYTPGPQLPRIQHMLPYYPYCLRFDHLGADICCEAVSVHSRSNCSDEPRSGPDPGRPWTDRSCPLCLCEESGEEVSERQVMHTQRPRIIREVRVRIHEWSMQHASSCCLYHSLHAIFYEGTSLILNTAAPVMRCS